MLDFGQQESPEAGLASAPALEDSPATETATARVGRRYGGRRSDASARPRSLSLLIEWSAILLLTLIAAMGIRTYVLQPYSIPSASMVPTLQVGDKILVNRLSYDFHPIHRGDVVVFKRPPGDTNHNDAYLIKRVIGLPGETISAHGGSVYIGDRRLIELWLPPSTTTAAFPPVHIPPGDYFVMGDNRGDSYDSRGFGPISGKLIVGMAEVVIWPPSQIRSL